MKKNYDQIDHEHTSVSALDWITGWSKTLGHTFKIKWTNFQAQIQAMINATVAGSQFDANLEHDPEEIYALDAIVTKWDRVWKSKQADNEGHVPPSDPEVTEDDWWIEQSKAEGTRIPTWTAGVFAETGRVVESNAYLYLLIVPEGELPFESSDLAAELAAGKWKRIGRYYAPPLRSDGNNVPIGDEDMHSVYGAAPGNRITPDPAAYPGREISIKSQAAVDVPITNAFPGKFYTWQVEDSTKVVPGQMITLKSDGVYWNTN